MKNDIKSFLCGKLILSALFVGLFSGSALAAVASCSGVDSSSSYYGLINGSCCVYHCATGSPTKIASVASSYCNGSSGSCTVGSTQTKYTASGCDYDTKTRECCTGGTWSSWGEECCKGAACCTSSQCWNGSKCVDKPTGSQYNGKCYYTCSNWKCTSGSGWSCPESNRNYQTSKTQKGTFTAWNDQNFYSKQTSTCSNRAVNHIMGTNYGASDSLAATLCSKHINGQAGIPDGTMTWSGSCTIYGSGWCTDYNGNITGDANGYCSTGRYKYQVRTIQCSVEETKCN